MVLVDSLGLLPKHNMVRQMSHARNHLPAHSEAAAAAGSLPAGEGRFSDRLWALAHTFFASVWYIS